MGTDQIPAPSCRPGTVGVTGQNNRLFVEAVLYRFRPGIPWRDFPDRFGEKSGHSYSFQSLVKQWGNRARLPSLISVRR